MPRDKLPCAGDACSFPKGIFMTPVNDFAELLLILTFENPVLTQVLLDGCSVK